MASSYNKKQKFITLLHELFQLNQPELDFGIYRIMHARKDDINRFVEQDLPRIVNDAFKDFQSQDKVALQAELAEIRQAVEKLGGNPDEHEKVKALQGQLAHGLDLGREEGEVYDALITFFSRYYDEGDFISRRVYKDGTYAIPYSGEEVVLHWANKDQYYIKSSETLRDYSFRLDPDNEANPMRVHFKLVDADPGAQNNVKESETSKRIFILDAEQPWEELEGEQGKALNLRFHYRATTASDWTATAKAGATAAAVKKSPTQDHCRQMAVERLLGENSDLPAAWKNGLGQPYTKADGEKADYPILQGQLNNYTRKNTFDYFIHKDLGGFLTRELDFYIKNELLRWEDVAAMKNQPARLAPLLSKIEVIRTIGEKIIAFLAQLEEFQKKLWLKKKFVTETNYCITLDRVPESLYDEIVANQRQHEEWERLGFTTKDTKITKTFLIENLFLILDTGLFENYLKTQLVAGVDGIDALCNGLLVHSENFQALNLATEKYIGRINTIYTDPPYNTGSDEFLYRDNAKRSSWLTFIDNRIAAASPLMSPNGSCYMSIDDTEYPYLKATFDGLFGKQNFIANIIWQKNFSPRNTAKFYSENHDYVLSYAKSIDNFEIGLLPRSKDAINRYSNPDGDSRGDWTSGDLTARNYYSEGTYEVEGPTGKIFTPAVGNYWRIAKNKFLDMDRQGIIWWGEDGNNMPRLKRYLSEVKDGVTPVTIWPHKEVGHTQEAKKELVSMVYFETSGDVFNTVKPTRLIKKIINTSGLSKTGNVLDLFAGSGSTGHAVIDLNREDKGTRNYTLIEMGGYFDTILKPRIQKVIYSKDWKDGKPKPDKNGNLNGVSHCFKYLRLESYEDALANLKLNREKAQQDLLTSQSSEDQAAREAYLLNYMLDVETRGSDSLLNVAKFVDPTRYQLQVRNPTGDETKRVNVDLLETFNWLIGLTVEYIAAPIHFDAKLSQAEHGRWQASVKRFEGGRWWFRSVVGTTRKGQKVLVVWRNLPCVIDKEENGLVKDNAVLDAVLIDKLKIRMTESLDDEFDILYVNGDHNITIPKKRNGELLEARIKLIEEDFHRLMFSSEGV
ncbi:MAG: modification methylase, type III R/M system [Gammaproteobacteria bacterium (ex Lamellibrachia satsuma)]|nr:MAG: site-specific DNA-methyltransferase [Gammaproteobacteria bacterium (ex Lamellibrachia satsuma)]RRS31642.1 MAG: modification methylase, type III R/M system [Gammaproteobacteria bacterium (ex Lamellibrachia satsuma)]RRS36133.1 MAG: modification methylase, type III R/M system [Gammaproteobacteria bacterium (ex Lamellibrachia satsuma)]